MSPDDMNSEDAAPLDEEAGGDKAADGDKAAKEEAKAAKKAEAAEAKAAKKAEAADAKAAKKAEAADAKTAKAEEQAAKKEGKKATREAATAQKAEKKAGTEAEQEAEAAKSEEEEAPSTLPAKVSKEKKPKKARKVKASSAKEVRRAIRPIRSKSQQTTARLIWAVFGMALVIVAIVGFWVVLSNQDDTTEIEVLVTAESLTAGNFLLEENVAFLIKEEDGTAYLPAANLDSLLGRVILQDVPENTLLAVGMFGEASIAANPQQSEITIPLNFPGEVIIMPEGEEISVGDRVVIFVVQVEFPGRYAFEVVDVAAVADGGTISIEGSYEDRAWWDRELDALGGQGEDATGTSAAVSFELESVDRSVHDLCWRERFRQIDYEFYGVDVYQIYGVDALSTSDYEQLIRELDCPWSDEADTEEPESSDIEEGAGTTTTTTLSPDSISQRLERARFTTNAPATNGTGTPEGSDLTDPEDPFGAFPGL